MLHAGTFDVRSLTAQVLGEKVGNIKVIPSEIGGGFGGKTTIYLEPLAVRMSQMTGRPVKMTMSREDVFRATGPTSGTWCRAKIGAKQDGTFTAASAWLAYEAGAFPGAPIGPGCMSVLAPYEVPNLVIEGNDVLVNKPKVCAYRAPGAPQSMHAMECAIDELARKLDMDPIDLRLKNAAAEGTVAPYGPRFPAIGLRECLEAAKVHPNYTSPVPEGAGRGVAVGFWFNIGMQSSAEVRIAEDGAVTVMEGSPDIGGSRASMALMAAETLGVPYEQIKAHVGDTESTGFCNVTGGSRTTFATGMAVVQACEDIIAQCKQRAALTWDLDEEQVDWVDGEAVPKPGVNADVKPLSLADIARGAGRTGGPLLGRASLNAQGAGASFSCNFTDTVVDTETGKVDVLSFTAVQDAGRAIHPSYVEGQMQGGAVQGIGWALNEEYIYDDNGVMENAGFLDYRVPVASDMPMIDTEIIEVPNPFHPYGVRGVGETPIVAPLAAVSNAVRDQLGFRIPDLPLSPPRVLEAIDEQGGRVAPRTGPHRAARHRRGLPSQPESLRPVCCSSLRCSSRRWRVPFRRRPTNPRRWSSPSRVRRRGRGSASIASRRRHPTIAGTRPCIAPAAGAADRPATTTAGTGKKRTGMRRSPTNPPAAGGASSTERRKSRRASRPWTGRITTGSICAARPARTCTPPKRAPSAGSRTRTWSKARSSRRANRAAAAT